MNDKKNVYSTSEEYLALLVKGALENEGIEVVLLDQKDSAYTVLGEYQLLVDVQDYEAALEIVDRNNS